MARLAMTPVSRSQDVRRLSLERSQRESHPRRSPTSSSSTHASVFSDKENTVTNVQNKGKAVMSRGPTRRSSERGHVRDQGNKRRRVLAQQDGNATISHVTSSDSEMEDAAGNANAADLSFYDPDQNMAERRAVRKALRDLTRELNDSRSEFLAPESRGLADTLSKANEYFHNVKQTSDATIDSRLLVSTADLSYKKTAQLNLGDAAQGIDVDEFVSKCITFMNNGPEDEASLPSRSQGTQRRRARPSSPGGSDDEGADNGDAFNWAHLGRCACFPYNRRPGLPSFLLGPLSVQKRTRTQNSNRRAGQRRADPSEAVQPEELQATDIEKQENSNLTILCQRIRNELSRASREGQAAAPIDFEAKEEELGRELTKNEQREILEKHNISDDGGVAFFRFVIHPHSFGQTVENLFYVSFLIRDGSIGISQDTDGMPTLHPSAPRSAADIKAESVQKHQAVFNLDFPTWRSIIGAFKIQEPMIPDRGNADAEVGNERIGARGWYG